MIRYNIELVKHGISIMWTVIIYLNYLIQGFMDYYLVKWQLYLGLGRERLQCEHKEISAQQQICIIR